MHLNKSMAINQILHWQTMSFSYSSAATDCVAIIGSKHQSSSFQSRLEMEFQGAYLLHSSISKVVLSCACSVDRNYTLLVEGYLE